ncbi:MAG: 8-oxo-dGTP diphosphatase [Glutamicibacter arilaitensis]|uniref:8-oxo-dGTP diphosphatase n=1 Tax=Glutamicibacter arilaitensis TaxID=256701 RepID=UPI003F905413
MASNLHGAKQIALVALVQHREGDVQILLGRKRRGFGQGNIVLPGGKIEPGETAKQAAIREFAGETGLRVAAEDLELAAQINFRFPAQPAADMQCAAFIARKATGQLELTEELEPLWADPAALPVTQMWQDSPLWLPQLAAGENFTVEIVLADDNQSVQQISFEYWQ